MYLIDTNVISEARKGDRGNPGVRAFFTATTAAREAIYLSVVTIGELRRGVELIAGRGDSRQAQTLERWLSRMLDQYANHILDFDLEAAQLWGLLRAPDPAHAIDKQVAAIALLHGLIVVTRNTGDFAGTGAQLKNPFTAT